MKAVKIVDQIIHDVNEFKKENEEIIAAKNLLKYLDALKKDFEEDDQFNQTQHASNLEHYKAVNASALAHYTATCEHRLELYRSALSMGIMALKTSILINGGAAIATLAFTGNVWKEVLAANSTTSLSSLSFSLKLFCLGVFCSTFATGCAYISESCTQAAADDKCSESYFEGWATKLVWFSVLLVVASYILFISGVFWASDVLNMAK